jgi:hypothetical protein
VSDPKPVGDEGGLTFTSDDLPDLHEIASAASGKGQRWYLRLSATRLIALLVATVAGAVGIYRADFDLSGLFVLCSFVVAAVAEGALIYFQPERDWYSGRAVAESIKTLAWRFSVRGEPFGPELNERAASELLHVRIGEVLRRGSDRMDIAPEARIVTEKMRVVRASTFSVRRDTYLKFRTQDQRRWYYNEARKNARRATIFRWSLLAGEVIAVVVAAILLGKGLSIDFPGVVAAAIASIAAWLALKQHSQLASAYRVAASELAMQASTLQNVEESAWPQAVADAEEAISREHTMWLASRGQEPI